MNGVDMQRFNTSTQKCESVHRTFTKTNPRHLTCKRNFASRIHSGIHTRNHGIAGSTLLKCEALGASHTPGTRVARKMAYLEKRAVMQKARTKSKGYKQSRVRSRSAQLQLTYKKDMNSNTMKTWNPI